MKINQELKQMLELLKNYINTHIMTVFLMFQKLSSYKRCVCLYVCAYIYLTYMCVYIYIYIYTYISHICVYIYGEVWPEGIQPCNIKNRRIYWRRYKIQETSYIGQWLSPLQSRHHRTSHSSPKLHQLPYCIFLNLIYGLKSHPFQRWF